MKIFLLFFMIAVLSCSLAFADEPSEEIKILVKVYQRALQQKSIELMEPKLSKNFSFGGSRDSSLAKRAFISAIETGDFYFSEIGDISERYSGDTAFVVFDGLLKMGGIFEQPVKDRFDAIREDGVWKFLAFGKGIIKAQIVDDPSKISLLKIDGPPTSTMSFLPGLDHIVVEGKFSDGIPRKFIIDSGTPISVIGHSFVEFTKSLEGAEIVKAIGVSGEIEKPQMVTIEMMTIGDFSVLGMPAVLLDIDHLSSALGIDIAGLLGVDFLSNFAWTLDYSSNKIILSRLDEYGELVDLKNPILNRPPTHRISVERAMHLLKTKAFFGDVPADIVIECGAGAGLIAPELAGKLKAGSFAESKRDTLIGADRTKSEVRVIVPKKITIGSISRTDYQIVISDISHINQQGLDTPIDGIFGYNFFSDWLITTRFDRNVIELRPIPK